MKVPSVFVASDHAGFDLKAVCLEKLQELGLNPVDLGPESSDRVDYPDFADRVCSEMKSNPGSMGLLICGSGQGMAMRANKHPFIRAGLCWSTESAELARAHNDANVLCVGARLLEKDLIINIIDQFFKTPFEGGRHQQRVEKVSTPL